MASSYKYLNEHDRVVAINELTELVVNQSGSNWISSSYSPYYFTQYASGTIWPLSTRVFDLTFGRSENTVNGISTNFEVEQNIYNQFAKTLLGYDSSNNVLKFQLEENSSRKTLHNAIFLNISRGQFKDKIQKGSFSTTFNHLSGTVKLWDSGSDETNIKTCNTGHYGYLKVDPTTTTNETIATNVNDVQGLIFYEAGVAVVSPYIFAEYNSANWNPSGSNEYLAENELGIISSDAPVISGSSNIKDLILSGTISDVNYGIAKSLYEVKYHAITELNSTIYFCRAYNHEFNYSANPTYLENSKIIVKGDDPETPPRTYITTVGLYSDDNQLLAVAKLSEPVLKTPENELIARVRLDF